MKPGDTVVCVDDKPESDGLCPPIVKGKQYKVLAVRDADLGPPKGEVPHELQLNTGGEFSMWYCSRRFKLCGDYGMSRMTLAEKIEKFRHMGNEVAIGWNDSGCFWHFQWGPRGAGNMMDTDKGFGQRFHATEAEDCSLEAALDALFDYVENAVSKAERTTSRTT